MFVWPGGPCGKLVIVCMRVYCVGLVHYFLIFCCHFCRFCREALEKLCDAFTLRRPVVRKQQNTSAVARLTIGTEGGQ